MAPLTFLRVWAVGCCLALVQASITVYSQHPFGTTTANPSSYTGAAAYNSVVLKPPPVPVPPVSTTFTHGLSSSPVAGVSIKQGGYFYGFSIEFSVINQFLGVNGSFLQVPFLNLMSNLQARGGSVRIRIGGNTQETATMVSSLPQDKMMEKGPSSKNPNLLSTPPLLYTPEVLYMLSNISSLVNVQWYLGIPLNDTEHLRLQIAEVAEPVLGDRLLGFQVGNEPDQYGIHGLRPATYNASDYVSDFGLVNAALRADSRVPYVNKTLIGPSISTHWQLEDVWSAGFLDKYSSSLQALSAEYYPKNNCARLMNNTNNTEPIVDPQEAFSTYLNHTSATSIVQRYLNSTMLAQERNLPFLMLETNTASCGGFAGLSDSFGSALWALDYGFQMAYSNFTTALLHVGGLSSFYNPFTPPPTNQSMIHSWSVGPIFYSTLVVAEAFGKSNSSRIMDLQMNTASIYTPGYAIYDGDALARLALFNFVTDTTGASDYTGTFYVTNVNGTNETPSQVKVKYLLAPSVSSKDNITWAGQSFGPNLSSDGRLAGTLDIQTIPCNTTTKTCQIHVPAPGFALVFLDASADDVQNPTATTFATTTLTKTQNTLSVDPSMLATSNGHKDAEQMEGSTGRGRKLPPQGQSAPETRKNGVDATRGASLVLCFVPIIALTLGLGL